LKFKFTTSFFTMAEDLAKPKVFRAKKRVSPPASATTTPYRSDFEEEVATAVLEWYQSRGLPVPPEDLEACKGLAKEREDYWKEIDAMCEKMKPKPEYGTPEFWKDYWAKKKAAAAAAAASGEPLPELKAKGKGKSKAGSG
jgi:hypothetical protein